ncbi:TPA: hypothetical protein N0F65_005277 [Lagenidium giganteum]|uniref:Elicitin n=1 Tax=Lagenidium giganteum TaxID=4803 RepID=A0AAV2YZ04_9STRA|nr:TPA: hypothetical protein N0F65_005277 [Lagenidium giganteum]
MKTFVALAAVAAVAAVSATDCKVDELLAQAYPLVMDVNYGQCQKDGGYSFFPFTGLPIGDQIQKLCASDACKSLLKKVVAINPPDCDLTLNGTSYNVKDIVNKYATMCLQA